MVAAGLWQRRWLQDAKPLRAALWRAVEAQHAISTLRLVDSADEQLTLERLLESSKPPLPPAAQGLAYLLATPFRYRSPWPSRFRRADEPGVWYGAEAIATACAEVGYWRWRFLTDSDGLRTQALLVEFTLFEARVAGPALDLSAAPWSRATALWRDPNDYAECQRLADAARDAAVQWLRYASVRDPARGPCGAVLDVRALALPRTTTQQTWAAKIAHSGVLFAHDGESLAFDARRWR